MKTTLESTNEILRRLGKGPVSALHVGPLATRVQRMLEDESRALQREGWHFNTKYGVTIDPNANSKYDVTALESTQIFHIDTDGVDFSKNFVRQGNFLYDLDNNTDIVTGSLIVTYSYELGYESIPEAFQDWAMAKAALALAPQLGASGPELQVLTLTLQRAETTARRDEMRRSDVNVLETREAVAIRGRRRMGWRSLY